MEVVSALCDYLGANLIIRSNKKRVDLNINSLYSALNLIKFFDVYNLVACANLLNIHNY